MAANIDPIFGLVPNAVPITINAANTAKDGSGSLFTVVTAGANGTRVDGLDCVNSSPAVGASVLKVLRVYLTDASGANPKIIKEQLLPLITSSNIVIGAATTITWTNGKKMKSGQLMKMSQSLCVTSADNTDVAPDASDY